MSVPDSSWFWFRALRRQSLSFLRRRVVHRDKAYVAKEYARSGTRDLDMYFDPHIRRTVVYNGQIEERHPSAIRESRIAVLAEILRVRGCRRVLEVGTGTGINLFLLHARMPDLSLCGIDLVPERIATGRAYFRSRGGYVPEIEVGDATAMQFEDDAFDAVFTVHCLEQMNRYLTATLTEIRRVTKDFSLFLEPDWKSSNLAQKLFLINNDYLRNLPHELTRLGAATAHRPIQDWFNPLNRTGLFIVDWRKPLS